jgi:hypothetical protein
MYQSFVSDDLRKNSRYGLSIHCWAFPSEIFAPDATRSASGLFVQYVRGKYIEKLVSASHSDSTFFANISLTPLSVSISNWVHAMGVTTHRLYSTRYMVV